AERRRRDANVLGIFQQCSRRIQNGGWARQVTQADFQIAEEISPVPIELSGFSGLSGDHPLPYPCQSRKAAHALSRIVVGLGASGEPLTLSLPQNDLPLPDLGPDLQM